MRNFKNKQGISRFLHSTPVLALLAILLLFFAYNLVQLLGKMRETVKNKEFSEEKLTELQINQQKLQKDITQLSTEDGLEESIREKFGMVKEGEGVIIVVENKKELEVELEANTGGIWDFFKNLFK